MKKVNIAAVLGILVLGAISSLSFVKTVHADTASTTKEMPPNIVIILSDDHAWNDYGFMGSPHVDTPALDKLAAETGGTIKYFKSDLLKTYACYALYFQNLDVVIVR